MSKFSYSEPDTMLSLLTGLIGGTIIARLFLLFKRIPTSKEPEALIMQIALLLMSAALLPFAISFFLDKN